jgi:hypothetical protein
VLDGDAAHEDAAPRTFTFTTPPEAGPDEEITFGVVGDLGQTVNSTATIKGLAGLAPDAILHLGDLSYSDGDHYRWDSYARLLEPLASAVPMAHVGGNHELVSGGESWFAYKARYPNRHLASLSPSFLWYSFEAGPAHILMLCSYANSSKGSAQYAISLSLSK